MKRKVYLCLSLILTLFFSCPIIQAEETAPQIEAESAILIDATTKTVLYEKNAYSKQYPASITKLMTALLAIENLQPTDTITFSKEAIFGIERGSSHIGMDVGEQITVDQALHGLLLMSANEVANGLAEAVSGSIDAFAIRMSDRAKELGALNTHFVNPHGLHDENHYTTAYDMSLIASYLADNEYFLNIMKDYIYQINGTNKTDEIRYLSQDHKMFNPLKDASIFREDVIGGKTGYTDQARHTLVTIAKEGKTTLVAVVMKSEKGTLYSDTNTLLDYGFNSYHSLALHSPNETIKTLPLYTIKSGQPYQAGSCSIGVEKDLSVLVRNDTTLQEITTSLELPEYIDMTAKEGDVIGEITYMDHSKILGTNKLVIQKIDYQSSPYTAVVPPIEKAPALTFVYVIGLIAVLVLILMLILLIRKKRRQRSNQLKFKKLFK
ncbi:MULTISPECIES: D-alanyl-D-alanine carboxypeptidase family protein [Cellulosilyticum]|uniref:serine-type D-Ala-D-Ala carboxypeptidase n=1 Tax=Cellulosilyticum lentocellum (strain ATCC 49066 / DSM 5427 / NCIMB 11756 / RHM5) TaxID=642492 RepID=F2JQX1_CELLD|nr:MULTISPECIES: D-alanyl-D-alanine carboxypeptidase family protein [Cellulosilyticum]ADZ83829.1 Serine-type D-Ala-D-Ala carboxypeptidase [Cellulosilyticum lentocellum DSM 5427]QEH69218.1 D-alanyl-D-alanine carboxypeptidase [Cellulosilyticum sp. WCF-2]